jgi:hypothetical protein
VSEWTSLRVGFLVVGLLLVAALISWAVQTATYEDPAFEQTRRCLVDELGRAVAEVSDPIAQTAELGALRTVIETNGVTVAVASSPRAAARIADAYRSVAGDLGPRLELRDRTVYLWDRPPSPTQRQALFDCTY